MKADLTWPPCQRNACRLTCGLGWGDLLPATGGVSNHVECWTCDKSFHVSPFAAPAINKLPRDRTLLRLKSWELEAEANRLLYGVRLPSSQLRRLIPEERTFEIIGTRLYIPKASWLPIIYQMPKQYMELGRVVSCVECGRPRSISSGQRCRACYMQGVKDKYRAKMAGIEWMATQASGVTLPVTPWFDEGDVPARPKAKASDINSWR